MSKINAVGHLIGAAFIASPLPIRIANLKQHLSLDPQRKRGVNRASDRKSFKNTFQKNAFLAVGFI